LIGPDLRAGLRNLWAQKKKKQNKFEGATYEEMSKGNPVGVHVENRLETECEMLDLFLHRHPEGDRSILQRKPQFPDSYRVQDTDKRNTL
jgi:hypothetical protein